VSRHVLCLISITHSLSSFVLSSLVLSLFAMPKVYPKNKWGVNTTALVQQGDGGMEGQGGGASALLNPPPLAWTHNPPRAANKLPGAILREDFLGGGIEEQPAQSANEGGKGANVMVANGLHQEGGCGDDSKLGCQ
jgi:hypothetical protein